MRPMATRTIGLFIRYSTEGGQLDWMEVSVHEQTQAGNTLEEEETTVAGLHTLVNHW